MRWSSCARNFQTAIVALDDPFYLATDARAGRGKFNDRQRVLTSIGWQAYGASVGSKTTGAK